MQKYAVIEKNVGETPLQALERFRGDSLQGIPLAYAGRLDPMASGKLLILIGDECKQQERYHRLDKEYEFEVLLGVGSDTGDVLGLLSYGNTIPVPSNEALRTVAASYKRKTLSLPYPHFSSKTVKGKPLHVWTLEGKLDEIEIPVATTTIYNLKWRGSRVAQGAEIAREARTKIDLIPEVTEESKKLGADFRRTEVRAAWEEFARTFPDTPFTIARFTCTCTSGTYMRSLAADIGRKLNTQGLAYSIHRTEIGVYRPLPFGFGFWRSRYKLTK